MQSRTPLEVPRLLAWAAGRLEEVLDGDLDEIIEVLASSDRAERLKAMGGGG